MKLTEAFSLLGVPPQTPALLVHQAYRRMVKQWHPDRYADQPGLSAEAENRLKLINLAYALIKAHVKAQPAGPTVAAQPKPAAANPPGQNYPPRFHQGRPRMMSPQRMASFSPSPPVRPAGVFHSVVQAASRHPRQLQQPEAIKVPRPARKPDRARYGRKPSGSMGVASVAAVSPVQPIRPVSPIGEPD